MFGIYHNNTYVCDEWLSPRIIGPFETEADAYCAAFELLKRFDPDGFAEAHREANYHMVENQLPEQVTKDVIHRYQDMMDTAGFIHVYRMETAEQLTAHLARQESGAPFP